MKKLLSCLTWLIFLITPPTFAQQPNLGINSFRTAEFGIFGVRVDLDCSNDGSQGELYVRGVAMSRNGAVPAFEFGPSLLPAGPHVPIVLFSGKFLGKDQQQTDVLRIEFYRQGKGLLLYRDFDFKRVWALPRQATPGPFKWDQEAEFNLQIGQLFSRGFAHEDFAGMNAMFDMLNAPGQTGVADNNQRMATVRLYLESQFKSFDPNWDKNRARLNKWRTLSPDSAAAAIAEGIFWRTYAWNIRGDGAERNVDPIARRLFRERLKTGEKVLSEARPYASNVPLWHLVYLETASDAGERDTFVEKLFREGIAKFPFDQDMYVAMTRHWIRRNGNANWRKIDDIVSSAVANTKSSEGTGNYAAIYRRIDASQQRPFELFETGLVTWPKMKQGFTDLLQHHPTSYNLNSFAAYACHVGDKETFLKLWSQIGDHVDVSAWHNNESPDLCKRRFLAAT